MENDDTQIICCCKIELEKILSRQITSMEISDLVKAHEHGCLECEGFSARCDYYKAKYLSYSKSFEKE